MILVCKQCKTSFLVPTSYFVVGQRHVRCGKCSFLWMADLHSRTEKPQLTPPLPPPRPPQPEYVPSGPLFPRTESAPPPAPDFTTLLEKFEKIAGWVLTGLVGLTVLAVLCFVFFKAPIIRTWPETLRIYYQLGLADLPTGEKVVLRNISSQNRYQDGAMHLVVEGEIHSQTEKTQILHTLLLEAIGPDGALIESWRIDPPAATLRPEATLPFHTAILLPERTVVEVKLSFVEPPHDEQ